MNVKKDKTTSTCVTKWKVPIVYRYFKVCA